MMRDIIKMKVITVNTLVDKFRVGGSLARVTIKFLVGKNIIKRVGDHHNKMYIYTPINDPKKKEEGADTQTKGAKGGKKK